MSRFNAPTPRSNSASKAPVKSEVRNSPIPKVQQTRPGMATQTQARQPITHAAIAQRAYFLWKNNGGSEFDNWIRAERELRAGK